jgi:hypothetical protein
MIINSLLWILLGGLTAYVYLVFQRWSVNQINPQNQSRSIKLIIGGAILRWLMLFTILALSISHSYRAMFFVFISFMVARSFILLHWQDRLRIKSLFSPQG